MDYGSIVADICTKRKSTQFFKEAEFVAREYVDAQKGNRSPVDVSLKLSQVGGSCEGMVSCDRNASGWRGSSTPLFML